MARCPSRGGQNRIRSVSFRSVSICFAQLNPLRINAKLNGMKRNGTEEKGMKRNKSGAKSFKLETKKHALKRNRMEWNESYLDFFQI